MPRLFCRDTHTFAPSVPVHVSYSCFWILRFGFGVRTDRSLFAVGPVPHRFVQAISPRPKTQPVRVRVFGAGFGSGFPFRPRSARVRRRSLPKTHPVRVFGAGFGPVPIGSCKSSFRARKPSRSVSVSSAHVSVRSSIGLYSPSFLAQSLARCSCGAVAITDPPMVAVHNCRLNLPLGSGCPSLRQNVATSLPCDPSQRSASGHILSVYGACVLDSVAWNCRLFPARLSVMPSFPAALYSISISRLAPRPLRP